MQRCNTQKNIINYKTLKYATRQSQIILNKGNFILGGSDFKSRLLQFEFIQTHYNSKKLGICRSVTNLYFIQSTFSNQIHFFQSKPLYVLPCRKQTSTHQRVHFPIQSNRGVFYTWVSPLYIVAVSHTRPQHKRIANNCWLWITKNIIKHISKLIIPERDCIASLR